MYFILSFFILQKWNRKYSTWDIKLTGNYYIVNFNFSKWFFHLKRNLIFVLEASIAFGYVSTGIDFFGRDQRFVVGFGTFNFGIEFSYMSKENFFGLLKIKPTRWNIRFINPEKGQKLSSRMLRYELLPVEKLLWLNILSRALKFNSNVSKFPFHPYKTWRGDHKWRFIMKIEWEGGRRWDEGSVQDPIFFYRLNKKMQPSWLSCWSV